MARYLEFGTDFGEQHSIGDSSSSNFGYDPADYGEDVGQDMKPPASESEIEKLSAPSPGKLIGEQCLICMSQYQGDDEALTMPCDHIFHKNCLITWLKNGNFCPICYLELKTDNKLYESYKEVLENRHT